MKVFTSKLGIMIAVITLAVFGMLTWSVLGGTRLALTLTSNPDLENGLVGHWTFDGKDLIENAVDRSGNGNTGHLYGFTSTTTTPGKIGQALDFDGVDDRVNVGTNSSIDNVFAGGGTLSVWIYPQTFGESDYGRIWHKMEQNSNDNGTELFLEEAHDGYTDTFRLIKSFGSGSGQWKADSGSIVLNKWQHIVIVYNEDSDTNNPVFYRNNEIIGVNEYIAPSGTVISDEVSWGRIGSWGDAGRFFDGYIDDMRLYDRELSADEISRLYHLGATTHINKTITTNPDLENGLVGHWTFDGKDMNPNARDISGQGNHGDLTNFTSTTTVSGKIGQALEFDGVNDYVDVGTIDITGFTGSSYSAWIKRDATGIEEYPRLLGLKHSGVDDIRLWYVSGSTFRFTMDDGSTSGEISASINTKWHHVVGTHDGLTQRLFVDGVEIGSGNAKIFDYSGASGETQIGRSAAWTSYTFDGSLDDVRIYNRALSPDEISRLYHLGATTHINKTITTNPDLESGLVGHWTFDGKDMNPNARDISGQGNHGDLTNFTSTTTRPGKIGQALFFDGVDDTVDIGSIGFQSNYTIALWFNPDYLQDANESHMLFHLRNAGNSYHIGVYKRGDHANANFDNVLGIIWDRGAEDATSYRHLFKGKAWNQGEWQHLVVTVTASEYKIYHNGVSYSWDFTVDESSLPTGAADGRIGWSVNEGSNQYDGSMDDVRIYNRVLSADEISRLYEMGR